MSAFVNAHQAFGTRFAFSSVGSSGTFQDLGLVISIAPPSFSRGTFDVSNYGQSDVFEQAIGGGIIRTGTLGLSCVYSGTTTSVAKGGYQLEVMPECMESGQRVGWQIVIPGTSGAATWWGDGFIQDYSFTIPTEGVVNWNATIKVTGLPTICSSCT